MTGNELFVKALQKEGIDYLFAYPGGYAIDIFDELYKQDSIQVILPRHEQGLIHAADGYARATGRTGAVSYTHLSNDSFLLSEKHSAASFHTGRMLSAVCST